MLISVPVLSDRLKSKQALSWVPLPNRRQTSATIKQPPPSLILKIPSLGSSSPLCSFSLVVQSECADRHCFHCTLPFHTYTYRITFLSTPTPLSTSLRIPGWTGCYRAECPFCRWGDLQTIHGRCTHSHLPPSYSLSLLFHRHTITSVRSFSVPENYTAG